MNIRAHQHKYQFAPAEKKLIAIYLMLGAIYAIASIYLLSTPIEDWAFNLGKYNQSILEIFPKAQYWVNVSIAFREKVIPLYPLYQVFFWFVFITTAISCITHWRHHWIDISKSKIEPLCKRRKTLIFNLLILPIVLVSILVWDPGSKQYRSSYQQLAPGLHSEYLQWNIIYGFVLYKVIAILGVGAVTLGTFFYTYSNIACFTNLINQQEQGGRPC